MMPRTRQWQRKRPQAHLVALWILALEACIVIQATGRAAGSATSSSATTPSSSRRLLVIGVDGGTESIRACCFDAKSGQVVGRSCAISYPTYHPQPGWAEQDPRDWYENLGQAVRGAIASLKDQSGQHEICAICVDTTCCSVVALDGNNKPLRRSLLWMDARSARESAEILYKCRGDPALEIACGGEGPLSAEWMTPKALWIRQNEPEIWQAAKTICEYQDFINFKLSGTMCASSCNAASRWQWDGERCLIDDDSYSGRPLSMYKTLGIPELADKLPKKCLPMGATVGKLTKEAAMHLNLPVGLPIIQGGADAFVGMIGLGCIFPGQLCLITGSSHLHCVVSSHPSITSPGVWGTYPGAPIPGINFAEGGQSSTGSILRWAKTLFGGDVEYGMLDREAALIPVGSEGLVALETFQGSRTPVTDPLARGALLGLTLSHTRAHVWRALMEAVCLGTRACVEALVAAGHKCDEIVIAGGSTRSSMWLQMHADATGIPVVVCENTDAPLLGCAVLASVGAGIHESVQDAVRAMVRIRTRISPNTQVARQYDKLYKTVYVKISSTVRPLAHASASLGTEGANLSSFEDDDEAEGKDVKRRNLVISPSLLACDWSNMQREVQQCVDAGAEQLHVDIFDGVFLDSPHALTFGPQMVKTIRQCCIQLGSSIELDLHVCVDRPARYVEAMADAGAARFIFQWEAMQGEDESQQLESANRLAESIFNTGTMKCGVSINPETPVESIFPLLETGMVNLVDVLAVDPGFGGQRFQESALDKVRRLVKWRTKKGYSSEDLLVMVDGGVNRDTAPSIVQAEADVLVSGSFLFGHPEGLRRGIEELKNGQLASNENLANNN